jgi:uncharacterized YigZ family protein
VPETISRKDFYFNTVTQNGTATYTDRGSKFIAYLYPLKDVADFKQKLAALKKEHAKATHHCFAYRLGLEGTVFRVSDDGEPAGTAGRPILAQIDSHQLTNVLIVVVRYFGGSLLGVPGLINAYKAAATFAIQVTPTVQQSITDRFQLQFDYTQMNEVMRIVKQFDCFVEKQEVQLFCAMEVAIPRIRLQEVLTGFRNLRDVRVVEN